MELTGRRLDCLCSRVLLEATYPDGETQGSGEEDDTQHQQCDVDGDDSGGVDGRGIPVASGYRDCSSWGGSCGREDDFLGCLFRIFHIRLIFPW